MSQDVIKYISSRFHAPVHVKMFEMPDSISTKDLFSDFAHDKLNKLQILKNRNSLRVTEDEGESSGMTGILCCGGLV